MNAKWNSLEFKKDTDQIVIINLNPENSTMKQHKFDQLSDKFLEVYYDADDRNAFVCKTAMPLNI